MHNLIITEKPSVARTISKVLGATARRDGYLEGGGWLVSWCVGHRWSWPRLVYTTHAWSAGTAPTCPSCPRGGSIL